MASLVDALPFAARLRDRRRRRRVPSRTPAAPALAPFALPLPSGTHVGQGRVVGVEADGRPRVLLLATGAEVVATWAIPFLYGPALGDLLWVVGRDGRFFVLGVFQGGGRSLIALPGEVRLEAAGRLRLVAGQGVRLIAPRLTLRAERLELEARQLHTKVVDAVRLVRGLFQQVAGRVVRVTEGEESVSADEVTVLANDLVKVDGGDVVKAN